MTVGQRQRRVAIIFVRGAWTKITAKTPASLKSAILQSAFRRRKLLRAGSRDRCAIFWGLSLSAGDAKVDCSFRSAERTLR